MGSSSIVRKALNQRENIKRAQKFSNVPLIMIVMAVIVTICYKSFSVYGEHMEK